MHDLSHHRPAVTVPITMYRNKRMVPDTKHRHRLEQKFFLGQTLLIDLYRLWVPSHHWSPLKLFIHYFTDIYTWGKNENKYL